MKFCNKFKTCFSEMLFHPKRLSFWDGDILDVWTAQTVVVKILRFDLSEKRDLKEENDNNKI